MQLIPPSGKGPELGHEAVLQQKAFPDLFFVLGKQEISAHTCIVQKRCNALITSQDVVKRQRKKKNVTTVELKENIFTVETLNRVCFYALLLDFFFSLSLPVVASLFLYLGALVLLMGCSPSL